MNIPTELKQLIKRVRDLEVLTGKMKGRGAGGGGGGGSGKFHYAEGYELPAVPAAVGVYFFYLIPEDNTWMARGGQGRWTSDQYTSDLVGLPGDTV